MSAATLTIAPRERGTLHWLMVRRLFILGQDPPALARSEGVSHDQLAKEFGEDLELMADLGWEPDDDRKAVDLTMPADRLDKAIKRLRRDARRAPCEKAREHEPEEADDERWNRFRAAVDTCEGLLDLIESPHRTEGEEGAPSDGQPPTSITYELSPVSPPDLVILAAVERAARHERSDEVSTATVIEHLGFVPEQGIIRPLRHRLDNLRNDGDLTRAARDGGESWVLTSEGRELLDKRYGAGEVGRLPESPQHRAWRNARVQAALRIEEFETALGDLLEEAKDLVEEAPRPHSSAWFALSERLSPAAWRLGSATHCFQEWVEPDDDFPDV
ncbi:MAG TPA: hypothetical protein VHR65_08125, partial [Solirubrobacterales bacterium]|nr:hypothetical protein [Solirubrobacterales bacterium]